MLLSRRKTQNATGTAAPIGRARQQPARYPAVSQRYIYAGCWGSCIRIMHHTMNRLSALVCTAFGSMLHPILYERLGLFPSRSRSENSDCCLSADCVSAPPAASRPRRRRGGCTRFLVEKGPSFSPGDAQPAPRRRVCAEASFVVEEAVLLYFGFTTGCAAHPRH